MHHLGAEMERKGRKKGTPKKVWDKVEQGCRAWPECLSCPFPKCREEVDPKVFRKWVKELVQRVLVQGVK